MHTSSIETGGHQDRHPLLQTPRIIAVGGAKGGIGKSLFAANLGVFLASRGKRTVLIDLDLGGANLHLFLGIWSVREKIDDFLLKRVESIEAIMAPSKYGPLLIGGGGGRLGSANLAFARKLKLLRAIKAIDADYVIIDLGGDTTYNILDFYLMAHRGVVLTTCEPAAYLDCYNFIKMGLYRRLSRIFGPEFGNWNRRNRDLEALIESFITTQNPDQGGRIDDLLDQVHDQLPDYESLVKEVIDRFRPMAVINMVTEDEDAAALVQRLQKVTQKMLSVQLLHKGNIPFTKDVQQSAKDLIPHVSRHPKGVFAAFFQKWTPSL